MIIPLVQGLILVLVNSECPLGNLSQKEERKKSGKKFYRRMDWIIVIVIWNLPRLIKFEFILL